MRALTAGLADAQRQGGAAETALAHDAVEGGELVQVHGGVSIEVVDANHTSHHLAQSRPRYYRLSAQAETARKLSAEQGHL